MIEVDVLKVVITAVEPFYSALSVALYTSRRILRSTSYLFCMSAVGHAQAIDKGNGYSAKFVIGQSTGMMPVTVFGLNFQCLPLRFYSC